MIEIWEKILLRDNKDYVERIINPNYEELTSLDKMMKYYANDFKDNNPADLENRDMAHWIYTALEWNRDNKYYDVINSFWTTFACGLISFKDKYIKGYYFAYNKPITDLKKVQFAEEYVKESLDKNLKKTIQIINNRNVGIIEHGQLCHCVANFMPCPSPPFNQAKGTAKAKFSLDCKEYDVNITNDYLPLMVELIQNATFDKNLHAMISFKWKDENEEQYKEVENSEVFYYNLNSKKDEYITKEMIEKWRKWFMNEENLERYYLEEYYYVIRDDRGERKLVGIPLFKNQSLSYPIPKTNDEVKECIGNIISRTKNRAFKMADKLKDKILLE